MESLDPLALGFFILGGITGALLAMFALCDAPHSAEEDAAAFRAGYREGLRVGRSTPIAQPGDDA